MVDPLIDADIRATSIGSDVVGGEGSEADRCRGLGDGGGEFGNFRDQVRECGEDVMDRIRHRRVFREGFSRGFE